MIRQIHDQLSKEWLAELLRPVGGKVETQRELSGEVYYADVSVEPSPTATAAAFQRLGLLGQMVRQPCLLEHFWNPPTFTEIRGCLLKLFLAHGKEGKSQMPPSQPSPVVSEETMSRLWILTTSASDKLLTACGTHLDSATWGEGIYLMADILKTGLVVINRLPETPETLWLRILGRGETRRRALTEFLALAEADPSYYSLLEVLSRWGVYVKSQHDLTDEEQELLMNVEVEAVYQKWKTQTLQEGLQQGLQQGRQEAQRIFLEQLLNIRFGVSNEALVQALLKLSTQESLSLILQLSHDELRAQFGLP